MSNEQVFSGNNRFFQATTNQPITSITPTHYVIHFNLSDPSDIKAKIEDLLLKPEPTPSDRRLKCEIIQEIKEKLPKKIVQTLKYKEAYYETKISSEAKELESQQQIHIEKTITPIVNKLLSIEDSIIIRDYINTLYDFMHQPILQPSAEIKNIDMLKSIDKRLSKSSSLLATLEQYVLEFINKKAMWNTNFETDLTYFDKQLSDYIHLSNYLQQKINQLTNNQLPQQRTEQQQQQIIISTNANSTYNTRHNRIRTLPQTTINTNDAPDNIQHTHLCNIL